MSDLTSSYFEGNMSTLIVFIGSILTISYLCYRRLLPHPIPGIPYNKEAVGSILGDIVPMAKHIGDTQEIYTWLTQQNVKLESPITQIFARPFQRPWVVITDFRESQDILLRRTKEFDRASFVSDIFLGLLPEHHISMKTNDTFKQHRRWLQDLMTPAFLHDVAAPRIYTTFLVSPNIIM
jgi:hypothetical protein